MDDYIQQLIGVAQKNPDYADIVKYLLLRDSQPKVKSGYLSGPDSEMDRYGEYHPATNTITMNSYLANNPKDGISHLTHEMTHAAKNAMGKQYYDIEQKRNKGLSLMTGDGLTDQERQFRDNYLKINSLSSQGMMTPEEKTWYGKNSSYRATKGELQGFGVGNMNNPIEYSIDEPRPYNPPRNVDATNASEFMMLLDQATRLEQMMKKK